MTTGTHNNAAGASTFAGNGTGTGILDTALLAQGWVFIENVSAVNAGLQAVGTSDVYRDPSTRGYIFVEKDDVNARIRVRSSERYTAGPTFRTQAPCSGLQTSDNVVTPTANGTFSDTDAVIAPNTSGPYINLAIGNSVNVDYAIDVTADLLRLSTRNNGATGAGNSNFVIVGVYSQLAPIPTTRAYRWFFMGAHDSTGWSNFGWTGRATRIYGQGATLVLGAWDLRADFPLTTKNSNSTNPLDPSFIGAVNGGTAPKGFNTIVSDAFLWQTSDNARAQGAGLLVGYIPDTVVAVYSTQPTGGGIDTLNVDGTTYYVFGRTSIQAGSPLLLIACK